MVDANTVFSSLLTKGRVLDLFLLNSKLRKFELIAPEYLLLEIEKHADKLIRETKLSSSEVLEILDFIRDEIEFIPTSEFKQFEKEASGISPDAGDVPYFALALKFQCPLLSGDKILKQQSAVKVISPADAVKMLKEAGE